MIPSYAFGFPFTFFVSFLLSRSLGHFWQTDLLLKFLSVNPRLVVRCTILAGRYVHLVGKEVLLHRIYLRAVNFLLLSQRSICETAYLSLSLWAKYHNIFTFSVFFDFHRMPAYGARGFPSLWILRASFSMNCLKHCCLGMSFRSLKSWVLFESNHLTFETWGFLISFVFNLHVS